MKTETKLWIRKRALMTLRAIVWRVDDWLHGQEVKLREDLASRAVPVIQSLALQKSGAGSHDGGAGSVGRRRETFDQWEAGRSGVAVISKKEARRRRERPTAADFDRRFA
jgi:hypothetical protein